MSYNVNTVPWRGLQRQCVILADLQMYDSPLEKSTFLKLTDYRSEMRNFPRNRQASKQCQRHN